VEVLKIKLIPTTELTEASGGFLHMQGSPIKINPLKGIAIVQMTTYMQLGFNPNGTTTN